MRLTPPACALRRNGALKSGVQAQRASPPHNLGLCQTKSWLEHVTHLERRASSSLSKHEGESSLGLCDRLDRTRDNSQRQLPTDHDYAVPTREYQTDQSSLKPAQAAARSVLGEKQKQRQKQPHRLRRVDRVTPYQGKPLIENDLILVTKI